MKFVTLMNPRPRRTVRRRRTMARVYRNPSPKRTSRAVASRKKTTSAAIRRKISLAVKAANRRRQGGPIRRAIARYSAPIIRRRRSTGSVSRFSGVTSIFSKPMLMKAGGAVGASFLTSYVLKNYGSKLPMADTTYGRMLYAIGIPFAGAYLVRKKAPQVAEGMIIGGLVMLIQQLINQSTSAPVAAPATRIPTAPAATLGAFAVAGQLDGTFNAYPSNGNNAVEMIGDTVPFRRAW